MQLGGALTCRDCRLAVVMAHHGSTMPREAVVSSGGIQNPLGFLPFPVDTQGQARPGYEQYDLSLNATVHCMEDGINDH